MDERSQTRGVQRLTARRRYRRGRLVFEICHCVHKICDLGVTAIGGAHSKVGVFRAVGGFCIQTSVVCESGRRVI